LDARSCRQANSEMNKAAATLLAVTLALVTIGVVMLFSVSAPQTREKYGDPYYMLKRQAIWLVVGAAGCVTVAAMPYHKLRQHAPWLLGACGVLLLLVLVPHIGVKVNGARRWLGIGAVRFQPADFAKIGLVLWLAHYLAKEKRRLDRFGRGFMVPMGVVGMTLLLILAEPDFGTTALLAAVTFSLMFIAGVRVRYLAPTILTGLVSFVVLIMHNPVRKARMLAFMDLDKYKAGPGYQVWQAILAFGSGGVSGLGLGNSRQKMFYLPESHTDFIFPIIGEELGLVGAICILLAFVVLFVCAVVISINAPDPFGQYLGLGVAMLLGLQTIINIGVVTAWLPTKGLPLPFISYGGSNLVVNLVSVGILLSIFRSSAAETRSHDDEFFAKHAE
jgi:cell division protein FtsW